MNPAPQSAVPFLVVRRLAGPQPYAATLAAMQAYTRERDAASPDQCWLLQHSPVFTLGLNGKREHLLQPGDIPVLATDRGGQVTYHGPGQWVLYLLLDLRRYGMGVRDLVQTMEAAIRHTLADLNIPTQLRAGAPGVYVGEAKIASLGLRIRHGCAYHGLALNTDMDLSPFARINPCGYESLEMTQVRDWAPAVPMAAVGDVLVENMQAALKACHAERAA